MPNLQKFEEWSKVQEAITEFQRKTQTEFSVFKKDKSFGLKGNIYFQMQATFFLCCIYKIYLYIIV